MTALAVVATLLAVLLAVPARPRWPDREAVRDGGRATGPPGGASAPDRRPTWWRVLLAALTGCGALLLVGAPLGVVVGPLAAAGAFVVLGRAESVAVRDARDAAAGDLPHLVDLLAATLRSGAAPSAALTAVASACPGAAADRLRPVLARLRIGVPAEDVWRALARDDVLAPLGHTLARAEVSGTSVADAIERLADDLEREALAAVEDRARAVGVKAAVPLGLCLLPAFILIGIVPTIAGLLTTLLPGP